MNYSDTDMMMANDEVITLYPRTEVLAKWEQRGYEKLGIQSYRVFRLEEYQKQVTYHHANDIPHYRWYVEDFINYEGVVELLN